MRIIFVTKVTGVDKANIVANDATLLRQFVFVFRILYQSTRLKFLISTNGKIRPGNRDSSVNRAPKNNREVDPLLIGDTKGFFV